MSFKLSSSAVLSLALAATASLASAKATVAPERRSVPASKPLRAIHIQNFSIGAGIDEQGGRAINAVLATELSVGNLLRFVFQSNPMAIEGEYNTCAEFKSTAEMQRVLNLLKSATAGSTLIRLRETNSCVGEEWLK